MFQRALVSVSDKSGLVEFLKPLVEQGLKSCLQVVPPSISKLQE